MVFLIAFWSLKQSKIEESSIESMAKQMEAHLHDEPKIWSFIVFCQKQIMNARWGNKERNLTWRIQENKNYWTHLEQFLKSISCILYVVSKLGKSEVQHFKRCTNQSWIEEVMAIGIKSHQAGSQFRSCEISLVMRNVDFQLAKSHSTCCMLWNPPECFQIFVTDSFRFFL